MNKLERIEAQHAELLRHMNENIAKIDELQAENRDLSRVILTLEREKEKLEEKEIVNNFKELAAKTFPNGYTIYRTILDTDYIGTESVDIIIWDNNINIIELDEILEHEAQENAVSYGFTLEEELPMLCEEYGYDDVDELIDQLGLEISGYEYNYEKIELEDLNKSEIQDLIERFL